MKKLLICSALASLVSANAMAYGVDASTFTVSVTMASAISYSVQPGNISISSLIPGVATTGTTSFTVDGDNDETLSCTMTATDLSSGVLTLYKDSDKGTNPSDTLVADIATDCNDGSASTITLTIESGDTDDADIGKTFGTDSAITLNVSYV